jgi:hypothetical protein
MFTVLFAIARTVGWIGQWKEMIEDPSQKIGRPRQLYTGDRAATTSRCRSGNSQPPDLSIEGPGMFSGPFYVRSDGACGVQRGSVGIIAPRARSSSRGLPARPVATPCRSASERFWLSFRLPSMRVMASRTPTMPRSCAAM